MINPNTLLSEEEIAILRDSKDWRNYLAIVSIWVQIALGFLIFSFSPSILTFLVAALIIGTRQFALVVMMHDGAHNLISKNKKINDFISQWLCAYPMMTETVSYRKYHLIHHKHTETQGDAQYPKRCTSMTPSGNSVFASHGSGRSMLSRR